MVSKRGVFVSVALFIVVSFFSLGSAEEWGYNLLEEGENLNPALNYSTLNVNNSQYFDGYSVSTLYTYYKGLLDTAYDLVYAPISEPLSLHLNQDNWFNDSNGWLDWDGNSNEFNEVKLNETIDQKLASTYYNASSIVTTTFTVDDGDVNSLDISGDGDSYNVSEIGGSSGYTTINVTGVDTFNTVLIRIEYDGSHDIHFGIYECGEDYEYEYGEVSPNEYITYKIDVLDPQVHVCSGVVSFRLDHDGNGNPSDDYYIDYFQLVEGFTVGSNQDHAKLLNLHNENSGHWGNQNDTGYNHTADYFKGDGSLLTGLPTPDVNKTYVDANDFWNRTGTTLSPKTITDDIETEGEINVEIEDSGGSSKTAMTIEMDLDGSTTDYGDLTAFDLTLRGDATIDYYGTYTQQLIKAVSGSPTNTVEEASLIQKGFEFIQSMNGVAEAGDDYSTWTQQGVKITNGMSANTNFNYGNQRGVYIVNQIRGKTALEGDSISYDASTYLYGDYENMDLYGYKFSTTGSYDAGNAYGFYADVSQADNPWAFYTKSGNSFLGGDNIKTFFGTGKDASIYYDGTNMIFNTSEVGSGLAYFSNNVSATGYNTRTEVNNDSDALETALDGNDMINEDGSINHSAFGECYNPINITDYDRPVNVTETKWNITILRENNDTGIRIIYDSSNEEDVLDRIRLINQLNNNNKDYIETEEKYVWTSYPYKKLQDEVDLVCMTARQEQRDALLNKNINLHDGLVEVEDSLLAEHYVTNTTKDPATLTKIEDFYNLLTGKTYQEMKDLILTEEGKLSDNVLFDYEKSDIGSYNLEAIGHTNRAINVLMLWKIAKIEDKQNQQLNCWDLTSQSEIVNCMRAIN